MNCKVPSGVRQTARPSLRMVAFGLLVMLAGCARQPMTMHMDAAEATCAFTPAISVHCGRTPTTAYDPDGRLWVSYVVGEHVYVAWSDDQGKQFSEPVRVNAEPEPVYTNGENRAKVAFGRNGEIYVSWTKVLDGPFFGDIRFTRSVDGGKSFEPVRTINDDGLTTSHRFESMLVTSTGNIFMAWLDKRDMVAAEAAGRKYIGAALYYTWSSDDGVTFAKNIKVADYSCECCRIAMSETQHGDVAAFWRHIYNETTRDHGFAELATDGVVTPAQRATDDNWKIEACPHHGPAMVTATDGTYHLSWFTLGDARKGIFYGRYSPELGVIENLFPVAAAGASHPSLARVGDRLYLVWKQFDGEKTTIKLLISVDEGASWQPASVVADTADASDHPLLITADEQVFLSWHTGGEGLRVIPLNRAGGVQ